MQAGKLLSALVMAAGLAAAADSTSADSWALEARSAFQQGNFKRAAKAWRKAVSLDTTNAEFRTGLGEAYERLAEQSAFPLFLTNQARVSFEYALRVDPNNAAAIQDLIDLHQEPIGLCEGSMQEASLLIRRLDQVSPDAAAREKELHLDAVHETQRPGQRVLCAPLKVTRVITDHLLNPRGTPGVQASAAPVVKPAAEPDSILAKKNEGLDEGPGQ